MRFSSSPNRPEGWKEMKLADICKTFTSGGTPSRKKPEYFENGTIPWVRTKELNDGVITEVEEFITPEALKNSSAKMLPKNTVLLAMYGATVGKLGVLGFESSCNQACAAMVPKDGVVDYRFLYYLLLNHRELIISQATGGAQQNLSGELIKGFTFDFPTYKEQEAIAEVLWKIDEKIAINNALSKTLEDIAQTLFKSWFIDFDPVKAKMTGEKPAGIDDETAALFPDSMEESQLGSIPKGWEMAPIGNALDVGGGTTPSTTNSTYWDGEHCWTTPKDLSGQIGIITTSSTRKITDLGLAQISSGLLPINSVLMSCRAPIGYVSINAVPTAVNQGFITMKHSAEFHPLYVLNWINANMQEIQNRAGGATFAEITRTAFRDIPFLKPANTLLNKYAEFTEPLLKELEQLTRQTKNLQVVRDLLLPRLISGELQIPEEMLAS